MPTSQLVRIGLLGHVGRFDSADSARYARGSRVVCRTCRGLEVGEVLAAGATEPGVESDGTLLRRVTVEDDLLLARLEQNRDAAYEACVQQLRAQMISATLVDVEHLFDGRSIYFYFLGEISSEVEAITGALAETYEAKVQFRRFTESVVAGCGPACGTEAADGCGNTCASCAIAGACTK